MKSGKLPAMSVDDLVRQFAEIGIAQDDALLANELSRFNDLFLRMQSVVQELRSRPGDQRRALLSLFDHPNPQVRIKAVKAALAVAPVAARKELEAISASKQYPQAGEAGMSLWNLDRGIFKPT